MIPPSIDDKRALLAHQESVNAEGVVFKRMDALYVPGPARTRSFLKWKLWLDCDVVVGKMGIDGKDNFEMLVYDTDGYYVAAGISGHVPGTPFLNDVIPLQDDWLEGVVTGAIYQPEFLGFFGVTDAIGEATATLDFSAFAPLPPILTGFRLSFAAFVFDASLASGAASNPCDLFLR